MKENPLILCLTNEVAANFTANGLLAVGAKPAMVSEPEEAAELASVCDALLVNLGTLTSVQCEAMRRAVAVVRRIGKPWVLDPVGVQHLAFRRAFAMEMIGEGPTLIRGNRAEIDFLRTLRGEKRGTVPVGFLGTVPVLATGAVDETPLGTVPGGVELLTKVTATGCLQGAICAAYLAWGQSSGEAALRASRLMKRAGERAALSARLPGSFQVALLDALAEIEK